jgi:hypothetical protein
MKAIDFRNGFVAIICKGCDEIHYVSTVEELPNGFGPWWFNKDYDKPTFKPSVNIHLEAIPNYKPEHRCHFTVTDGKITYCDDCTHSLKKQTIDLPEITENDL